MLTDVVHRGRAAGIEQGGGFVATFFLSQFAKSSYSKFRSAIFFDNHLL
jgi:hypothetical protein